mmetsp:Transcript_41168/g.87694  ORF Transcript_41168/g.87694 Transcript_41168/m.87694 type:complete len:429 (+) Transcript_41168:50-1336(+)
MVLANGVVGIFWDGENVRVPRGYDVGRACNEIRNAVSMYGAIVEKSLYFDSRKDCESKTDRVHLDLSGFKLVDCPTRGQKETLDKKIIVDLLLFACQYHQLNVPCTIVLLSGDGDYSYMLSRVHDMGVKTLLIFPEDRTLPRQLFNAAELKLSWKGDVLKGPGTTAAPVATTGPPCTLEAAAAVQVGGDGMTLYALTGPSSSSLRGRLADSDAEEEACGLRGVVEAGEPPSRPSAADDDSVSQMTEGRGDVFLMSVFEIMRSVAQRSQTSFDEVWATDTSVALEWYKNYGSDRVMYIAQRDTALKAGYILRRDDVKHMEIRLTKRGLQRIDPDVDLGRPVLADAIPECLPLSLSLDPILALIDEKGGSLGANELGQLYIDHLHYKAFIASFGGPKKFCEAQPLLAFQADGGAGRIMRSESAASHSGQS